MWHLMALIMHLFGVHMEPPTGRNPGFCWRCGKKIPTTHRPKTAEEREADNEFHRETIKQMNELHKKKDTD